MECYIHSERRAIGTCVGCGKFICEECRTEVSNKNYCKSCVIEIINENKRKLEKLEESSKQQPMVFMNAGGGSSSSSSSSSAASGGYSSLVPLKSKVVAGLLAIFLGGLGFHKFYLGKPIQGLIYIFFCWTFIPSFIAFIEGILYFTSSEESFARNYGTRHF
jgi:TM2 domain-containing membrane protein YozV